MTLVKEKESAKKVKKIGMTINKNTLSTLIILTALIIAATQAPAFIHEYAASWNAYQSGATDILKFTHHTWILILSLLTAATVADVKGGVWK